MLASDRVFEVFADAKQMQEASLERLGQNDIRDASEKAWCATKRAVDALVLARTGHEPEKSCRDARYPSPLLLLLGAQQQVDIGGRTFIQSPDIVLETHGPTLAVVKEGWLSSVRGYPFEKVEAVELVHSTKHTLGQGLRAGHTAKPSPFPSSPSICSTARPFTRQLLQLGSQGHTQDLLAPSCDGEHLLLFQ